MEIAAGPSSLTAPGEGGLRVLRPRPAPPVSSLLIKPVSALCNLACSYCFYIDRESDPYRKRSVRTMSRETLAAMIRNYMEYSPRQATFAWQGGEPTLAGREFFEEACRPATALRSVGTASRQLASDQCDVARRALVRDAQALQVSGRRQPRRTASGPRLLPSSSGAARAPGKGSCSRWSCCSARESSSTFCAS